MQQKEKKRGKEKEFFLFVIYLVILVMCISYNLFCVRREKIHFRTKTMVLALILSPLSMEMKALLLRFRILHF